MILVDANVLVLVMSRVLPSYSRLHKLLIVILLLVRSVIVSPVVAQQVTASALQDRVAQLLSQPRFESGFWGVHIVSLKNRTVLFSSNAKKRFIPASNMKLLIGAAALDRLGADFRFETPVFAEGPIDSQGRLLGNLILAGRGDPNLENRSYDPDQEELPANDTPLFISKIVDQVMERGVRTIVGDIVADETHFLHEPIGLGWALENLPWSYGAPVSSLAVNENIFKLEFLPGETAGSQALMRTYPSETGIQVINQVSTAAQGKSPSMHMEPSRDGRKYTFRGGDRKSVV